MLGLRFLWQPAYYGGSINFLGANADYLNR